MNVHNLLELKPVFICITTVASLKVLGRMDPNVIAHHAEWNFLKFGRKKRGVEIIIIVTNGTPTSRKTILVVINYSK